MMPWNTVKRDVVISALENAIPRASWSNHHYAFAECYGVCVEMEFTPDKADTADAAAVSGLQAFWVNRNGNIADAWALYEQVVPASASVTWIEAFEGTRVVDLHEGSIADAPDAEKKSVKKASGKKSASA
jgi:hypothetical protein